LEETFIDHEFPALPGPFNDKKYIPYNQNEGQFPKNNTSGLRDRFNNGPNTGVNQMRSITPLPMSKPNSPPNKGTKEEKTLELDINSNPYGLLGILPLLRNVDPDLNIRSAGTDLTVLGLNLSSPDVLYATFASPFSSSPLKREPDYSIPSCYYMQPELARPDNKMSLFSEDTLFYIFYSMPGDIMQIASANELQSREWYFHKELKIWIKKLLRTLTINMTKKVTYILILPLG